ncbi:MAG TPA: N-acyl homoserine lactonase family protein, partial [Nitrospirota bacterium]|nr:N-acyl homoserine lactonase family protein [Nitrospirota bacterium]
RREFLKSGTAAVGVAAIGQALAVAPVSGASNIGATDGSPSYEIYALKYAGPFKSKLAFVYWKQGWDDEIERYYYIWAIKGRDETIIVDTGQGPTYARKHKSPNYVNPVDVLERIGIKANSVKKVVITHIHQDHAGGIEMFPQAFPQAIFYVQKNEFDFWIKSPIAKKKAFADSSDQLANNILAGMEGTEKLRFVCGDQKLMPGIELLLTPGHTIALQSVAVNTRKGTAIVASDCAHIAQSFKDDMPSSLICDLPGWMQSFDKLKAKASSQDLLFPGHDAKLLHDYPQVALDVTRLV